MAKPTGAKEQSDYGLDLTSATEDDPYYMYHVLPVYRQGASVNDFNLPLTIKPDFRLRRVVGTDTTLNIVFSFGTPNSADFEDSTVALGWSSQRSASSYPMAEMFDKIGSDSLSKHVFFVVVEVRAWCESTGSGPNTTEISNVMIGLSQDGGLGFTFGYTETPHQTSANRLYNVYRSLTAYHVRKILLTSYNALMYSAKYQASLPAYGTFV